MSDIHPLYLKLLTWAAENDLLPREPGPEYIASLGLMSQSSVGAIQIWCSTNRIEGFYFLDDGLDYVSIAVTLPEKFLNENGKCYLRGVSRFVTWLQSKVLGDYLVEDHTFDELEKLHRLHLHKTCPWFARSGSVKPKYVPFHARDRVNKVLYKIVDCEKMHAIFSPKFHLVLKVSKKKG